MVKKRLSKLSGLKAAVLPPEEISIEEADIVFIGWGSTRGALIEASESLKNDGIKAGIIHFTELWPLPEYDFPKNKTYWSVEGNSFGQLSRIMKCEYNINIKGLISRYDGLPITGDYIRRQFYEQS
jgi:2-oxoglutarate ferredoxin oxidoreductase subunit alpha